MYEQKEHHTLPTLDRVARAGHKRDEWIPLQRSRYDFVSQDLSSGEGEGEREGGGGGRVVTYTSEKKRNYA